MSEIWVIDCDDDESHVTLHALNLIFLTADGVADFDFSYGTSLNKKIVSATLIVNSIDGDMFTPYLNVAGAKGLFVNEQIAKIFSTYEYVDILPLTILHNEQKIKGNWFYCNPTIVLDIIDWEKSEVTLTPGGSIMMTDNLVFKESEAPLPSFFRVENYELIPFITQKLYQELSNISTPGFDLITFEEWQ